MVTYKGGQVANTGTLIQADGIAFSPTGEEEKFNILQSQQPGNVSITGVSGERAGSLHVVPSPCVCSARTLLQICSMLTMQTPPRAQKWGSRQSYQDGAFLFREIELAQHRHSATRMLTRESKCLWRSGVLLLLSVSQSSSIKITGQAVIYSWQMKSLSSE